MERIRPLENAKNSDLLLINSPISFIRQENPSSEPSFGQLRIANVLEQNRFKPAVLDLYKKSMTVDDIDELLSECNPKIVGINPTSVNLEVSQILAQICQRHGIPIIIGGGACNN